MEWISVSEKLPDLTIHENEPFIGEWDNSEPVLVYHNDDKWECKYLVAQYTNGFADVGEPILYGWVEANDGEEVRGVIAWMPLPRPYTADRKTENYSGKPNNLTGYNLSPVEDEPQTEETEIERLERIDNELEDAWARIRELTDEPQTEVPRCSVNGTPYDECGFCEYFNCDTCRCEADEPQTDCAWK